MVLKQRVCDGLWAMIDIRAARNGCQRVTVMSAYFGSLGFSLGSADPTFTLFRLLETRTRSVVFTPLGGANRLPVICCPRQHCRGSRSDVLSGSFLTPPTGEWPSHRMMSPATAWHCLIRRRREALRLCGTGSDHLGR